MLGKIKVKYPDGLYVAGNDEDIYVVNISSKGTHVLFTSCDTETPAWRKLPFSEMTNLLKAFDLTPIKKVKIL